jgi:DNA-binding response OmpR family regulator
MILVQTNENYSKSRFLKSIWDYDDSWSLKSNILEMHLSKLKNKMIIFFKKTQFLTKTKNNFLFYF